MENKVLSIGDAASVLIGAGLTKLDDVRLGLLLIGIGVALKILIAVLQRYDIPVSR